MNKTIEIRVSKAEKDRLNLIHQEWGWSYKELITYAIKQFIKDPKKDFEGDPTEPVQPDS